jgi:hypothetical protein
MRTRTHMHCANDDSRRDIIERKGADMATVPHQTAPVVRQSAWLEARDLFAALAIASIWLAVLFVGVFGSDLVSVNNGSTTTIPSGIIVAFFALFATMAVAKHGFRRNQRD